MLTLIENTYCDYCDSLGHDPEACPAWASDRADADLLADTVLPDGWYRVDGQNWKVDGTMVSFRRPKGGRLTRWVNSRSVRVAIIKAGPERAMSDYMIESRRCGICGRELTAPDSIEVGMGQTCWGRALAAGLFA